VIALIIGPKIDVNIPDRAAPKVFSCS